MLDFFVHESVQRQGLGFQLFQVSCLDGQSQVMYWTILLDSKIRDVLPLEDNAEHATCCAGFLAA